MEAKVVLRKIAAAAANFVHLAVRAGRAVDARADAAFVGFCPYGFDRDPVVVERAVAAEQLRNVVDGIDHDIQCSVVIEVADGHAAAGDFFEDAGAEAVRHFLKSAVAEVAIGDLALLVAGLREALADFRVDVAIGKQNIRPAVVVEVKKRRSPTEEARDLAEARLERPVLKEAFSEVAVEA